MALGATTATRSEGHKGMVMADILPTSTNDRGVGDLPSSRPPVGLQPERVAPEPRPFASSGRILEPAPSRKTYGPTGLTLSVVVPTLNEAGNMSHVLEQLEAFDDIVIIDGMSEDATAEIVRELRPDAHVIEQRPTGKGDALRAGFAAATGDVIVMLDADGSMDAREVDVFMAMIGAGFDLVKGSRLAVGGGSHDLTLVRWAGNKALTILANRLYKTKWTDLCYGYVAFRRDALPRLGLESSGFEIESELLGRAALAGLRIAEVPSIEMPRIAGESHLEARRDGVRVLRSMLSTRFAPRAKRSAMELRPMPPEPPK